MVVNLEDEAKVEFDPAKLVSDDSSSDTKNIDTENWSQNQICNTLTHLPLEISPKSTIWSYLVERFSGHCHAIKS